MTKENLSPHCSVTKNTVDGGVIVKATGECTQRNIGATKSILRGYVTMEPDFIIFDISELSFKQIEILKELCEDFLASKSRLYLTGINPEFRDELSKEVELFSCDIGCCVCSTPEEALEIAKKEAA